MFTVKGNAPETFETPKATNWERDAQRRFTDVPEKPVHGRRETRSIECISPLDDLFTIPHVRQMFRITRERNRARSGKTSIEHACGITSLPHAEASPARASPLPQPRTLGHRNSHAGSCASAPPDMKMLAGPGAAGFAGCLRVI